MANLQAMSYPSSRARLTSPARLPPPCPPRTRAASCKSAVRPRLLRPPQLAPIESIHRKCRFPPDHDLEPSVVDPLLRPAASTRAAHGAAHNIAGRTLMLKMRFFSFRQQKPLVNMMIDKIPRQQLVGIVTARDVEIRIGQIAGAHFSFAMNLYQLVPDRARTLAARRFQPLQDTRNSSIAP